MAVEPRRSVRRRSKPTAGSQLNAFESDLEPFETALMAGLELPKMRDRFRQIPLEVLENIFMQLGSEDTWHALRKTSRASRFIALSVDTRARWVTKIYGPRPANILLGLSQMGSFCSLDLVKYFLHTLKWIDHFPIPLLVHILEHLNEYETPENRDDLVSRWHRINEKIWTDVQLNTGEIDARSGPVVLAIEALRTPAILKIFANPQTLKPFGNNAATLRRIIANPISRQIWNLPGMFEDVATALKECTLMQEFLQKHHAAENGECILPAAFLEECRHPKFLTDPAIRATGQMILEVFNEGHFDLITRDDITGVYALNLPCLVTWLPQLKEPLVKLKWMHESGHFLPEFCAWFLMTLVDDCTVDHRRPWNGSARRGVPQVYHALNESRVVSFYHRQLRPFLRRGLVRWNLDIAAEALTQQLPFATILLELSEADGYLPDFTLKQALIICIKRDWIGTETIFHAQDLAWLDQRGSLEGIEEDINLDPRTLAAYFSLRSLTWIPTPKFEAPEVKSAKSRTAAALAKRTLPVHSPADHYHSATIGQAIAAEYMPNFDFVIRGLSRSAFTQPDYNFESALPLVTRDLVLSPVKGIELSQLCKRLPHLIVSVEHTLAGVELEPLRLPSNCGSKLITSMAVDADSPLPSCLMTDSRIYAMPLTGMDDVRIWPPFLRKSPMQRPASYKTFWPAGAVPVSSVLVDLLPANSPGLRVVLGHILLARNERLAAAYARKGVPITTHHLLLLSQTGIGLLSVFGDQICSLSTSGEPPTNLDEPISNRYDWERVLSCILQHEEAKLKLYRAFHSEFARLRGYPGKVVPMTAFHKSIKKVHQRLVDLRQKESNV